MSEQTPNSSDNLNGSDPSMEEILASIRKIIADDEPVAMESPEDIAAEKGLNDASEGDLDELIQGLHNEPSELASETDLSVLNELEAESVDLNIDDVLAGLDGDILEAEPAETPVESAVEIADDEAFSDVLDDILAEEANVETVETSAQLTDSEDDILALLEEDIPLDGDPVSETVDLVSDMAPDLSTDVAETALHDNEISTADTAKPENVDDLESVDDIDSLLNGLLGEEDAPLAAEGADLASLEDLKAEPASVGDTEDLDLVKSLMADLSDDTGAIETDADLEAMLAIPEVEDAPVEALASEDAGDVAEEAAEEDILGDIVNMTIDDEFQSHPDELALDDLMSEDLATDEIPDLEDVLEAEQENIAENAQLDVEALEEVITADISDADNLDNDFPSLSEIAAAAEADAVAVETAAVPPAAAVAGIGALAGITAISGSILDDTPADEEAMSQDEPAEIVIETTSKSLPTQETEMPVKAVKTDAILDDITQTATAGAFAELNQVVEDRAIFNERGPRIGDLVQEALRPMLKDWLDENLKGIVERAVAKEVKRISQGK